MGWVQADFERILSTIKYPHPKPSPNSNYGGNMANGKSIENLKPFKKGDPRTKGISAMGGEATKRVYAERKKMKDELNSLLKIALKRGDIISADDVLSLEEAEDANISAQTAINIAMIKRAIMGDVQAAQYLRDTVGEKPSDKVELDQSLTIEAWAKKNKVRL